MAFAAQDISYVRELVGKLKTIVDASEDLEHSRITLFETARKLTDALENPTNSSPTQWLAHNSIACLKIALDIGIFGVLAQDKNATKTAEELAELSHAEPLLIKRIMRVLTSTSFAKEVGNATYSWTPKCAAMADRAPAKGMQHAFNMNFGIAWKAPEYFKANGYKDPSQTNQTPFQYAFKTTDSYFQWMQKRPEIAEDFNALMRSNRAKRADWVDWFPVQSEILDKAQADPNAALMVDLGGGQGRDLAAFRAKFPEAPGRYILEEQQHVIDSIEVDGIEKVVHNFFNPQPIKGAKFYFTHYIMHNWNDESCIQILKQTASAMTKGYSKLILNEWILPDVGCTLYESLIDIQMMMSLAGMERTRSQWQELLEKAGLKLDRFWLPPEYGEGIIEASLQE